MAAVEGKVAPAERAPPPRPKSNMASVAVPAAATTHEAHRKRDDSAEGTRELVDRDAQLGSRRAALGE